MLVSSTINYRTNILGFYDFTTYPGCEDFDSNCGLSDQILALNWIHDNVEAFGGDPERITIAGESAGGASVTNMLVCPWVKGCFTQAIIESGLPNCVTTHKQARENIDLFLEGMHWTEKDMAQHLKNDDPHLFLLGHEYVQARHQYKTPGTFLPSPVIDDLLPLRPIDALPKILGFYHEDGRDYFRFFKDSAHSLSSAIPPLSGDIRQFGGDAFIRFATDYAFEMPAVKVADAQRKFNPHVWMYRYELITKSGVATGWKASHAFELPFVFEKPDHPFTHFEFDGESPELFEKMCADIHGDWVRFFKTGEPNPDWGRFEGADSPVRIYDRETRTEQLDRRHLMQIWGDMRFYEN